MQGKAIAKYIRISPRKMKPICDVIRGINAKQAVTLLEFTPRRTAKYLQEVLKSAIANAENNHHLNADNLFVKEVYANQGPRMKRFKAGSHGKANPRLIRTSHIGVVVAERE